MKTKAECKLSPRQRECLEYIIDYIARYQYPPTLRELGELMGVSHESIHNYHLPYLVKKGAISVHGACAIRILVPDKRLDKLRDANWIGERMEKRTLREITA